MSDRSNISLNAYATCGQNLGTGTGVFVGKCDNRTLQFRTISSGSDSIAVYENGGNIVISGNSGGAWGEIQGTISNQTDLYGILTGITANISTISGQTNTNASNILLKLNTTDFDTYSGNTETIISNKTDSTLFNTYTGDTETLLNNKLDLTGGTLTGEVFGTDLCLSGNLNVDGCIVCVHAQDIYTENDFIYMRSGATGAISVGNVSGLAICNADGLGNDVVLGTGSDAIMRVGWSGDTLQAIATREDSPVDGGIMLWNSTGSTLVTSGMTIYQLNSFTATTSANTIDNLQSGLLSYNKSNKTYEPHSGLTTNLILYTGDTSPTGTTKLSINGVLEVTEFRASTANTNTIHQVGDLFWDNEDQTLALTQSSSVVQQIGQESYIYAKNDTGIGINNGDVVYINGEDSNRPTIALARASSGDTAIVKSIIGLATEDIPNGEVGFVTSFGLVKGLNTSGFVGVAGDSLYVSTTISGGVQETKPTYPDYAIKIGVIAKKDGIDGRVLISIKDETSELDKLTVNNGITRVSDNIKLGGVLNENTIINLNDNVICYQNNYNGATNECYCFAFDPSFGYGYCKTSICHSGTTSSYEEYNVSASYSTFDQYIANLTCQSQLYQQPNCLHFDVKNGTCRSVLKIVNDTLSYNCCQNGGSLTEVFNVKPIFGASYSSDYSSSSSNNPRWIPDAGWVTGQTASLTANNGLTKQGDIISLGGLLTGDTVVDGNTHNLNLSGMTCVSTSGVFYPPSYAELSLPLAASHEGGMVYVNDIPIMAYSDGTNWRRLDTNGIIV